ncbi:unnamed protein product [Paramecium primaurelia]|uniref:Uncharacterized protein n=1 Tax=Paramecium primaurelia TaxID=5886 RepID=A0A8S1KKZ2_PARPR|nr:unnamed protein product [Paramecium primaurelia]
MNNVLCSFSPFINRNSNIQTENIEFKMRLLHFEPLNINTQPIKQTRIKIERNLSPISNQNYTALFLNKIKVQKMAIQKAKLSSSIDYKVMPQLQVNDYTQFLKPTTLVLPSTQRSNKKYFSQSKPQKCKDNSLIESEKKARFKIPFRLPKIEKCIEMNESRSSLNRWTMNSSSSLLQAHK